jgi:hypothetical protein
VTEDELCRRDRLAALARLEAIADELALVSDWLGTFGDGEHRAQVLAEAAWRDLSACCWQLSVPGRLTAEGYLTANGYRLR